MSDNKAKAEQLKLTANNLFKENKLHEAIDLYTEAIALDNSNAILYANRSMTYIKIEQFGLGLEDASRAIELDPKYVKGNLKQKYFVVNVSFQPYVVNIMFFLHYNTPPFFFFSTFTRFDLILFLQLIIVVVLVTWRWVNTPKPLTIYGG